ncbi:phenylpyruvate tautomerase MIF-related protein [Thioalkalivibrio sp. ALgr1]|uniref:phenylpyruvate tautomerase MIF-related protein n=1 Tax=Thioalkalivibrio sp. ALgr1 TaxID=748655 RepID=UPI0003665780|nr:phenylpyruvate tautomerase MIF-related protein [Thioalkalivibrio sp. ALgr1]
MPLLRVETNTVLPDDPSGLCQHLSAQVADWLGKSEGYVMVTCTHNPAMCFAGSTDPLAYCELKSIDLPEGLTRELSRKLCDALQTELGLDPARVYIEFSDAPRHFWGTNSTTF